MIMEESTSDKHEESCTLNSANENGSSIDKVTVGIGSLDPNRTNDQSRTRRGSEESSQIVDENSSPSRSRECVAGTKVKRKLRSTRRKLNAMINNTSLHFSDTDSEGELTSIQSCPIRPLNHAANDERQGPIISVTCDDVEVKGTDLLSPTDDKEPSLRSNFVENLTDVDEIYPSDPETEQKESQSNNLKVAKSQGDATDLEDFEGEDEVDSMIYVKPRSDIFCDYSGETITTKEGDGPFSVEVRNKLYREEEPRNELCNGTPDIVVVASNTDEEEMDVSEEEDAQEACCSQRELLEDLDVLVASQVVMKNINKMENMLTVRDVSDDGTGDCHTDVEEVDPNE